MADDEQRVKIAEAADEGEAEVIRELLESQGIVSSFSGEGELGSPDPAVYEAPRAVYVHAADAEAARQALADAQAL
jgi:hypothetical protein